MKQEKVNKILHDHKEWLKTGCKKGMCANLYGADLRGVNLYESDLRWANLQGADLHGANLQGADLSSAKIQGADFIRANLRGVIMPEGIYTAGGVGNEQRYTYYDAVNDRIICGCWDDDGGNHLDSFKKRIENIYGPDGKEPNPAHYKAYRAAIQYFETCRESYAEKWSDEELTEKAKLIPWEDVIAVNVGVA